ncbi:hypothetical protein BESB_073110 [Besnoitia besnoiti]|uniref:Uncharacterized protein n=1 Tax=Besnoitia besnoiti TaxID=94643 RepID=A0A2A9M8B0_BESBE|nr:uncharacterized protein BESB_073110 [Besnoitia besnoiti]PFH34159.1 hypothetical protein BESB_073110 [Besnoitia besnoiti]
MDRPCLFSSSGASREEALSVAAEAVWYASAVADILAPPSPLLEAAVLPCEAFDAFFPPSQARSWISLRPPRGSHTKRSQGESGGTVLPPGETRLEVAFHVCDSGGACSQQADCGGEFLHASTAEEETGLGNEWVGVSLDDLFRHLAVCQCKQKSMYAVALSQLRCLSHDKRRLPPAEQASLERDQIRWARLALLMNGCAPLPLAVAEECVRMRQQEIQERGDQVAELVIGAASQRLRSGTHDSEKEVDCSCELTDAEDAEAVSATTRLACHATGAQMGEFREKRERWKTPRPSQCASESQEKRQPPPVDVSGVVTRTGGEATGTNSRSAFCQLFEGIKEELAFSKVLLELHPKCGELWASRRFVCRNVLRLLEHAIRSRSRVRGLSPPAGVFTPPSKELSKHRFKTPPTSREAPAYEKGVLPRCVTGPSGAEDWRTSSGCSVLPSGHENRVRADDIAIQVGGETERVEKDPWLAAELAAFVDAELGIVADHATQRPHSYHAWEHFAKLEHEMKAFWRSCQAAARQTHEKTPKTALIGQICGREGMLLTDEAPEKSFVAELQDRTRVQFLSFVKTQCGLLAHSHAPFHHISKMFDSTLASALSLAHSKPVTRKELSDMSSRGGASDGAPVASLTTLTTQKLRAARSLLSDFLQFNADVINIFPHAEAPWCGRAALFAAYIRRCFVCAGDFSFENTDGPPDCDGNRRHHGVYEGVRADSAADVGSQSPFSFADQQLRPADRDVPFCAAFASEKAAHCKECESAACLDGSESFSQHVQTLIRDELLWSHSFVQRVLEQDRGSVKDHQRAEMITRWQERHRIRLSRELLRASVSMPVLSFAG